MDNMTIDSAMSNMAPAPMIITSKGEFIATVLYDIAPRILGGIFQTINEKFVEFGGDVESDGSVTTEGFDNWMGSSIITEFAIGVFTKVNFALSINGKDVYDYKFLGNLLNMSIRKIWANRPMTRLSELSHADSWKDYDYHLTREKWVDVETLGNLYDEICND